MTTSPGPSAASASTSTSTSAASSLAPHLRMVPHHVLRLDDSSVQIRTAANAARIRGPSIEKFLGQLIGLLDGTRTEVEVLERYPAKTRARQAATSILASLRRNQMLEELDPRRGPGADRDDALGRYLASLSRNRSGALGEIAAARVGVFAAPGNDGLAAARVIEAIASVVPACAALGIDADLSGITHAVVLCPEPAVVHEPARELNDRAVEAGISISFAAVLAPDLVQIGPTVYPTQTACLSCIEQAFRRNNPLPVRLEDLASSGGGLHASLLASPAFAVATRFAALDALHAVSRIRRAASASRVLTVRLDGLTMTSASFTRAPRCGSCGGTRFAPPMRIWA